MMPYTPENIPVFAGPTLPHWQAERPFVHHRPAAAGDLLRLLAGPPCTVVLIDGLFNNHRAVWHKEILVLMARGFRVIGAGGIGALRAAELAPFGMIGVGAIFAAYSAGKVTSDEEVSVGYAEPPYATSISQIDVRATLVRAVRAGILDGAQARRLREASDRCFYKDRNWPDIITTAQGNGTIGPEFAEWIARNAYSLKAADAALALALAAQLAAVVPTARDEPPHTYFLRKTAHFIGVNIDTA